MTPKTKAAIEEAAKLPTAYQTLNSHLSRVGLTLATAHESILLDAIESHTAAHTAALRDQIADLERENNNYRIVYDSVVKNRDELRERIKELETLMQEFVDRVDRGEVRSRKTYAKFKEALK